VFSALGNVVPPHAGFVGKIGFATIIGKACKMQDLNRTWHAKNRRAAWNSRYNATAEHFLYDRPVRALHKSHEHGFRCEQGVSVAVCNESAQLTLAE